MNYIGQPQVYQFLNDNNIPFEYHEHEAAATIDNALEAWRDIEAAKCKNIFFRNHKGNRHYLVILEHKRELDIHNLEKRLKQGKLTFASEKRLEKYLGLKPGSVSPFGLINDTEHHVYIFLDKALEGVEKISFHPNDNHATLVVNNSDLKKMLELLGNGYAYIDL